MKESRYVKLAKTIPDALTRARVPLYMYGKSNHIHTVWQHIILLAFRQHEGKGYRRFVEWLREACHPRMFMQLGKVLHYTTLQKFASGINGTLMYGIRSIHASYQDQEIVRRYGCIRIQVGQCTIMLHR